MNRTLRPFLMFRAQDAEAATTLHVSPVPDKEILDIHRYGAAPSAKAGSRRLDLA